MKPRVFTAVAACLVARGVTAQGVAASNEPHHHLVYQDTQFRVLRVDVAPHDTTLLHHHGDYFWFALGASNVVNAVVGRPEGKIVVDANSFHFTRGPIAHVARNASDQPFRNITVELRTTQSNPKNLCEQVLPAAALNCPDGGREASARAGSAVRPSFATDQIRVSLATVAPGGTLHGAAGGAPTLLIVAEEASAAHLSIRSGGTAGGWKRGVARQSGREAWEARNSGSDSARVVLAEVLRAK